MRNILRVTLVLLSLVPCVAHADETSERERQITCLARNIYEEARGESIAHQKYVALITAARVADERWPNTFCGVVYEKNQFSWTRTRKERAEEHIDTVAWTIAHMIARGVYRGLYEMPENMKCARWYKRTDGKGVSKNGGAFFEARLFPVSDFGAHTAYCEKGAAV